MCGIVGIVSRDFIAERSWLAVGRDAMHHRGPDDAGEWWSPDGRAGLGHRRLSVIDLSAAGRQPMADSKGELWITFNGEIYNFKQLRDQLKDKGHVFRTGTDTEVLLASYREWGDVCVEHLRGMFAFGLYDCPRRRLLIARDRAGEKPLFFVMTSGALRFASELKALLADPSMRRTVDAAALDSFLATGYVSGGHCILSGVNKLPPAHAMSFDVATGSCKQWRYWNVPTPPIGQTQPGDEAELLDQLESLLEDSVRSQLVADVPVGVFLSGGLDSSLLTAMAARSATAIKTFTMRLPGYGSLDETNHARLIARHFGTCHSELDAGDLSTDLLPILARQFDEPIADSSMIPSYLVSRLVRKDCVVALTGDGGDELFGGYQHYNRFIRMQKRFGWIPRGLRSSLSTGAETTMPVGFKGRAWMQTVGTDFDRGPLSTFAFFDRRVRTALIAGKLSRWNRGLKASERPSNQDSDVLARAMRADFEGYLAEDILVKSDRTAMINSLETRAPLLDSRVVEFAFGRVPSRLKATSSERKVLLKRLAARVLPANFDLHRKQGFSIPLAAWLGSGSWSRYFRDVLLDDSAKLFERKQVVRLLDGQARGRSNSERLFALVMLELWRREYNVEWS